MAKNSFQFDVTLGKNNYIPIGEVKQSDTMDFSIRVLENDVVKNLTGDTCTLYVKKQDGTILEQKEGINITGATSGTLTIRVKNQATTCPGMTFFELEFKGADGIATSGTFLFTVNARVASGEAIQSKDEIQALEQVEKYVKEAKAELQKFKELQTAMLETNNSLNNQEERRVEAERLRAEAEKGRATAETKREEFFNKVEGIITANTEELETARTATTGETFNNLDERIDAEVERINKNIEISFLKQKDSESHTIENTIEGMTKDMIIKGRTLQNLFYATKSITLGNKIGWENSAADLQVTNEKYTLINVSELTVEYQIMNEDTGLYKDTIRVEGNSVKVYTLKENEIITRCEGLFSLNWTSGDLAKLKNTCYILKGDWTNKPITKYFEGTKSFGQEEGEISILSKGKNLLPNFNSDGWEKKNIEGLTLTNSSVFGTPTYSGFSMKHKIYLKADLTYSCKATEWEGDNARIRIWEKDSKSIVHAQIQNKNGIRVTKDDYYYISVENNGQLTPVKIGKIMFTISPTIDNYVSYQFDKKNVLLSEYGFNEGLRGVGTAEDELNAIINKAIKKIEKYVFTGDESILDVSHSFPSETSMMFGIRLNNAKLTNDNVFTNKFKNSVVTSNREKEGFYISVIGDSTGVYFRILKEKLEPQGVEGFKKWLKSNQTFIYYELAEPIEIPLNKNINLKVFNDKTYVYFENELSGISSFKAPVNAAATISRLSRENKALEEENLRLKKDTYKNSEDIILTNEELQITQSAVDHLLFGAVGTAMLYNGKKKGGGSMGAYLAMRIIKGKLKYDAVMKQYGEFKEDIDMILKAEGYGHLITQQ